MSKQFYWGVVRKTKGKRRVWPQRFHFRWNDAKGEMHRWNKMYGKIIYTVQRFLIETEDQVHYDIYEHEFKRKEKK